MIEHLKKELAKSMSQDKCTNFIKEMLERVKGGEKVHEFLLANGIKYDADIWNNYPFVDVYRDDPKCFTLKPKPVYRACKNAVEAAKFIGAKLVNNYESSIIYTVIAVSDKCFYCSSKLGPWAEYPFKDMFTGTLVKDTKEKVGVVKRKMYSKVV